MSAPSIFRYLGFALEDPYNESPAPVAQVHCDLASATLDAPTDTEIEFEGGLGRASRTHRAGFYSPAGNYVVAADVDTAMWFLYSALGGYVFTQDDPGVGDNTHEIYGVNNAVLPSACVRLGKDVFEHIFSGVICSSLTLEVSDGFMMITVENAAAIDAKGNLESLGNLLLPVGSPRTFVDLTATRDASDVTAQIKTFTMTITNNTDAPFGRSIGSRFPRKIVSNARTVTIDAELFFEDTSQLELFWGGASGPADGKPTGTTEFDMDFVIAGDTSPYGITIAAPRCTYTTVPQQPSGRTQITQGVSMKAWETTHTLLSAATVESEILATIVNQQNEMAPAV